MQILKQQVYAAGCPERMYKFHFPCYINEPVTTNEMEEVFVALPAPSTLFLTFKNRQSTNHHLYTTLFIYKQPPAN